MFQYEHWSFYAAASLICLWLNQIYTRMNEFPTVINEHHEQES